MWTYVQTLLEYTPVHLAGLVAVSISIGLFSICYLIKSGSPSHIMSGTIMLAVISVWPLAYIASLTVLGAAGAGFQSRFLLPALPATAVLTSIVALPEDFMNALPNEKKDKSFKRFMNAKNNNAVVIIVVLLVLVGAFHTIYYCVLYPNLFADFEVSIADVIGQMLSSPLRPLESKTALSEMANFMIHHGLNISR